MADTDLEVIVETQHKPVDVDLDKGAAGDGKAAIVPAEEGIESLKEQIARSTAESARRLGEKDRIIAETAQRAVAAEREVVTTRKDAITTTIESLTKDKDGAKRDLKQALEIGDYEKVADAQDRISAANARIVAAEQGRQVLEEESKAPPRQHQPIVSDPVEELARRLEPRSAAWIRQHPEYVGAGELNAKMIRAHHSAIGEGLQPETDSYFTFINRKLGLEREPEMSRQPPPREDLTMRQQDDTRSPLSAPVGREVSQSPRRQASPGRVHLSADEVSTALALNLDPKKTDKEVLEEYARNKVALMSEGKIAR